MGALNGGLVGLLDRVDDFMGLLPNDKAGNSLAEALTVLVRALILYSSAHQTDLGKAIFDLLEYIRGMSKLALTHTAATDLIILSSDVSVWITTTMRHRISTQHARHAQHTQGKVRSQVSRATR